MYAREQKNLEAFSRKNLEAIAQKSKFWENFRKFWR